MIYVVAGILSSALLLLYRRPPSHHSPLHGLTFSSSMLNRRMTRNGNPLLGRLALLASFLILFLVAACRYGIGTDYWSRHVPVFEQIRFGYATDYEIGFVALNRVVAWFTGDAQWLIVVMSFLTIFLVYRFIIRMSLQPALSVLVFVFGGFYLEAFNLAQQWLAVAILLNTIELALRRKRLAFVVLTILAVSIHSSAVVWLAFWPLLVLRLSRFWQFVLTVATLLVILTAPQLLIQWAGQVAPDYAWYLTSDYGEARAISPAVLVTSFLLLACSFLAMRNEGGRNAYEKATINMQMMSLFLFLASITVAYFFARLIYYFSPIQMIALPLLLAMIKKRHIRLWVGIGFLILYGVAFVHQFIVWNAHGVMPYESAFSR